MFTVICVNYSEVNNLREMRTSMYTLVVTKINIVVQEYAHNRHYDKPHISIFGY